MTICILAKILSIIGGQGVIWEYQELVLVFFLCISAASCRLLAFGRMATGRGTAVPFVIGYSYLKIMILCRLQHFMWSLLTPAGWLAGITKLVSRWEVLLSILKACISGEMRSLLRITVITCNFIETQHCSIM